MDATQRALAVYVNRATDLAEAVKHDIQKKGFITDETVLALNAFIIAANNIKDLEEQLDLITRQIN